MDFLRLASNDDPISRVQAERVRALLEARPDTLACVELRFGWGADRRSAIENLSNLLRDGAAHAAVVPADALPGRLPRGVTVGAFLRDRTAQYRCVAREGPRLGALRPGAVVVTTDPVARAQIRYLYPRLRVETVWPCGEILDALWDGAWDAACLPADLLESGPLCELRCREIPADEIVPAVGTGAVAVLVREGAPPRNDLVRQLDDPEVRLAVTTERIFLSLVPPSEEIVRTARARRISGMVEVTGVIAHIDGAWLVSDQASVPSAFSRICAREVADSCLDLIVKTHEAAGEPRRTAAA